MARQKGNQKTNLEREKVKRIKLLYRVNGPSLVALKRRGTGLFVFENKNKYYKVTPILEKHLVNYLNIV
jgi:hypothetical protein